MTAPNAGAFVPDPQYLVQVRGLKEYFPIAVEEVTSLKVKSILICLRNIKSF